VKTFSDFDLYFMGLLSQEQVQPLTLIDSSFDPLYLAPGMTLTGTPKTIIIQQVVSSEGQRSCATEYGEGTALTIF
jgi:hypothetical protein